MKKKNTAKTKKKVLTKVKKKVLTKAKKKVLTKVKKKVLTKAKKKVLTKAKKKVLTKAKKKVLTKTKKKIKIQPQEIKLVFDARMIENSGIGVYIQNLLHHMSKIDSLKLRVLGNAKKILKHIPELNKEIVPFDIPIYSIKEQYKYPNIYKDEILHVPHYNAPLQYLKQSLVTIHDLIHLHSKEFTKPHYRLYAYFMFKSIAKNAEKITCVSKSTKIDFLNFFPDAREKVEVIHNGFDEKKFYNHKKNLKRIFTSKYLPSSSYFLHIGINKKHKNIDFIIRALAPAWRSGHLEIPLILVGCDNKLPSYIDKEIQRQKINSYVHSIGKVSSEKLALLYNCAQIFLFPSLIEGFGFPILEAMASETPVLCSHIPSLVEVGGDAIITFNPKDEKDFFKKLKYLLQDENLRKTMIRKGKKQIKKFSWEKHIQKLIHLYENIQKKRKVL